MLYLLYGKDTFRSRQKLNELLDFFRSKTGKFGIFRLEGEKFPLGLALDRQKSEFEELLKTGILFAQKHMVICERLMENKFLSEFVSENFSKCADSENVFIFWEESLDGEILKLFKKNTDKIEEFKPLSGVKLKTWLKNEINKRKVQSDPAFLESLIEQCGSDLWCASKEIEKYGLQGPTLAERQGWTFVDKYNPFAICDAIARKNKVQAWILFQKAALSGIPAEEVFWKIVWQIKNLLLIKSLSKLQDINIVQESGLHPYVVKKTMSAINNFTEKELQNYSSELVKLYHNARRGLQDFPTGLERLLIS